MAATASTSPTLRTRRVVNPHGKTLIMGVLLLLLILFGDAIFGRMTATARLDDSLRDVAGTSDVVVITDFEPERFHIERLSRLGVFSGRDGEQSRIRLQRVSEENLTELARKPWITRIEPM